MNSKQILLRIPKGNEEIINGTEKNQKSVERYKSFEKYLGTESYLKIASNDKINFLEKNNKKVSFVLLKITDKDYRSKTCIKLQQVFDKLIKPFLPPELNFLNKNKANIKDNLDKFFNLQYKYNTIVSISSILDFHAKFLNFLDVYFLPLIDREKLYIHQEIYSISSNIYTENDDVLNFAKNYIDNYNVEFIKKHKIKQPIIDENDQLILVLLQNVFNNIIKKLQKKVSNKDNKCTFLTYGSYTSFIINSDVVYNDIDIYMTNPLSLLVTFLVVIKIVLDIDVDIFKIPYVIGHVSLRYKNIHFTDCLYIDDNTISNVPKVVIKEISFVHPIIQVVNLFRMMSELRRMSSLSENLENRINTEKKLAALLQYSCEKYQIDINKDLTDIDLNVEIKNNAFIVKLTDIFKTIKGYGNVKDQVNEIDYLVVLKYNPQLFLTYLKDKNPIIRKQWFALFNEIVAEFHNKKSLSSKNKKINKKKLNNIVINEECLIHDEFQEINDTSYLDNFINNNNLLLMSNFTTDFYMKTTVNDYEIVEKNDMSNITKETVLSSFVLTQILTNFNKENFELVKFYFTLLLSFIKSNNKNNEKVKELEMLGNPNKTNSYIKIFDKNKIKGKHETFALSPVPKLKSVFFYKRQEESFYKNYQNFLDVTTYN